MKRTGFCGSIKKTEHPGDTDVGAHLFSTGVSVGTPLAFGSGADTFGDVIQPAAHDDDIDTIKKTSELIAVQEQYGTILDCLQGRTRVHVPFPLKPVSFKHIITRDIHIRLPDGMTIRDLIEHQSDPDNLAYDNISYEVKLPEELLIRTLGMQGMESEDGYKVVLLSASVIEQTGMPISTSIQLVSHKSSSGKTMWFPLNTLVMNGRDGFSVSYMIPANSRESYHDAGNSGRLVYSTGGHVESKDWRRWATVDMEQLRRDLIDLGRVTSVGRVTVLTLNTDKMSPDTVAEYFLITQFHLMAQAAEERGGSTDPSTWITESAAKGIQLQIPEQIVLDRFQKILRTVVPHRTLLYLNDVRVHVTPLNKSGWKGAVQDAVLKQADAGFDVRENVMSKTVNFGVTIRIQVAPVASIPNRLIDDVVVADSDVIDVVD